VADILIRFIVGGAIVSAFAVLSDLFKPKSFAGIFGAAPSVALATIALTVAKEGRSYGEESFCNYCVCCLADFASAGLRMGISGSAFFR
jgi:hypothetical protein